MVKLPPGIHSIARRWARASAVLGDDRCTGIGTSGRKHESWGQRLKGAPPVCRRLLTARRVPDRNARTAYSSTVGRLSSCSQLEVLGGAHEDTVHVGRDRRVPGHGIAAV